MNKPDKHNAEALVGRFVVEIGSERQVGLAADEVLALVEGVGGENAKIYRIHRLDEAGRMELVGVSQGLFTSEDCLIFSRRGAAEARADYEAIRRAAGVSLPPCRIELQLAEATSRVPPHVVAMIFPAACSEGVGHWLGKTGLRPGDHANGGRAALQAYRDAGPRVIDQATLQVAAG
jgi:hypothetical protein